MIQHFLSEGLFHCVSRLEWDLFLKLPNEVVHRLQFRGVLLPERRRSRGSWNTFISTEVRYLPAVRDNPTLDGLGS